MLDKLSSLNLPFYIVIIFIFSYLIWSKFINKNKLKPRDINDILDILGISFFIILFLVGNLGLLLFIEQLLQFKFAPSLMWKNIVYLVTFVILMGIFSLITFCRYKKVSRKDLRRIIIKIMKFYVILIAVYLGLAIVFLVTVFRHILLETIILLPYIVFVLFGFCYIISRELFKINLLDLIGKTTIKMVFSSILIVILFTLLLIPIITKGEEVNSGYFLYGPNKNSEVNYLKLRIPINIKTFGLIDNILPWIPISYKNYNFDLQTLEAKNNFKLFINTSEGTKLFVKNFEELKSYNNKINKKYSFTDLFLDENRKLIILKFDKKNIKKENINQIILEGYVKKNISKLEYSYSDNFRDINMCYNNGCSIKFEIISNSNLPIHRIKKPLFNLDSKNILNISNCKFNSVSSNYQPGINISIPSHTCESNHCDFEIYNRTSKRDIFKMSLYIEHGIVWLHHINVEKPISIKPIFYLFCPS